jgi:hypothetical protein
VATEHPPDPVAGDGDATPALVFQLQGDPVRPEAGMSKCKGHYLLLDLEGDGVGHLRPPAFTGSQDLGPVAFQQLSPAVIAGGVDLHHSAGLAHAAKFLGQRDHAQAETEENVIIGHGGASFCRSLTTRRMAPSSMPGKALPSQDLGDRTD